MHADSSLFSVRIYFVVVPADSPQCVLHVQNTFGCPDSETRECAVLLDAAILLDLGGACPEMEIPPERVFNT